MLQRRVGGRLPWASRQTENVFVAVPRSANSLIEHGARVPHLLVDEGAVAGPPNTQLMPEKY